MKTLRINTLLALVAIAVTVTGLGTGPAEAQTGRRAQLEEVVVTATRREERLQDVSIPVTVLGSERVQTSHAINMKDLQYLAPSLTIGEGFLTPFTFMRGLGLTTNFGNVDPSVGFYVDGAVLNTPQTHGTSLFDVERVEVLRGPQGTLFGRNTVGGAINITTRKPTEEFEAYVRASTGKYELLETEGAISGPLTDKLLGRFAWRQIDRNGFGENEFTGNDIDDVDRKSLRAHLQYNFNRDVDFLLTGEYFKQDDSSGAFVFGGNQFPEDPDLLVPIGAGPNGSLAPFADNGSTSTRDIAANIDPTNKQEHWSVVGTFNWRINNNWSIKNILNYRESDVLLQQDLDFTPILNNFRDTGRPSTNNTFGFDSEEFSEEIQLHFNGEFMGNSMDAVAGFFYFHEKRNSNLRVLDFPTQEDSIRVINGEPTPRLEFDGDMETDSFAVFWNLSYGLESWLPGVTLTLGGRYTEDEKEADSFNQVLAGGGAGPPIVIPPSPFNETKTFSNYTNQVGLEWRPKFKKDLMFYYVFSEGFKSGTSPGGTTDVEFVEPEEISNHEFGIKSQWLDRRLTINLAGYFYELDNLTFLQNLPAQGTINSVFDNITEQEAKGIELEFTALVTDQLRIGGVVSWIDAELGDFTGVDNLNPITLADPNNLVPLELGGNDPRRTPEWAWTFRGEYDLPLALDGVVTLGTDISFKDEQFFEETNNPRTGMNSHWLVDAQLRYKSPNDRWSMSLWGKNLTNRMILTDKRPIVVSQAIDQTFAPPLTWGVTVQVNFE